MSEELTWRDIPLWLRLEERIGFYSFLMSEISKRMPKSGIDAMIDEATGYDKVRLKDAQRCCRRLKRYKTLWARETGNKADLECEEGILALK